MENTFTNALSNALNQHSRMRNLHNMHSFVCFGKFKFEDKDYAFMFDAMGKGTYRCQDLPDYANIEFTCDIEWHGKYIKASDAKIIG